MHIHSVYDTDLHFAIDPDTREIKSLSSVKTKLVQYDHNSERITFEIPRLVDGHDMTQCDKVEIHFFNVSSNKTDKTASIYLVDDIALSLTSDDIVIFSWLVSQMATKFVGILRFSIRFVCLTGETLDYVWNTAINEEIAIVEGISNSEAMVEDYTDALAAVETTIEAKVNEALTEAKESGEFDYIITEDDKSEIVSDILAALPTWEGGSY